MIVGNVKNVLEITTNKEKKSNKFCIQVPISSLSGFDR